jgi:hypothetical protein
MPTPEDLRELSPAHIDVISVLQRRPEVQSALDLISDGWSGDCLVHGDLRFANILARRDAASDPPEAVILVDWEFARLGDPAWDVGSALHSLLMWCLRTVPVHESATPAEAAEAMGTALGAMHTDLRLFWETYVGTGQPSPVAGSTLLERATRACCARLLQSAYELGHRESAMPGRAAALLQLGLNLLAYGNEARDAAFGPLVEC